MRTNKPAERDRMVAIPVELSEFEIVALCKRAVSHKQTASAYVRRLLLRDLKEHAAEPE